MFPSFWTIGGGIGIGAALGALMGYFGKCSTGACPLTSTPLRGMFYGMFLGLLFALSTLAGCKPSENQTTEKSSPTTAAVPETKEGKELTAAREVGAISSLVHISNASQFDPLVIKNSGLVLVDFFATWCPPCQKLGPELDALSKQYDGKVTIVKVDVDRFQGLAKAWEVEAMPTLILFKAGKPVERIMGFRTKEELAAIFEKNLKP